VAGLYVAAGVKQQESCRRGLIEDGVANGAKSLGRMSGTEFNAYFDPAVSQERRMSHKSPPIGL